MFWGGRGGAKTVSFSKALLIKAAQEKTRVVCLREYMNSIEDSVHGSLSEEIATLGFQNQFNIQTRKIEGHNGSLFSYRGIAKNIASIKSLHGFNIAWVEEAETVSEKSLLVLEPTLRESGSEIWYSFNPKDEFGAVYAKYVKPYLAQILKDGFYEDDDIVVVKVGLEDNPFAPQELIDMSEKMKIEDPKMWLHIWGGGCDDDYSESIIQPEWIDAAINAHVKMGWPALGVKSAGLDPADTGLDAKAIVQRHGSVITKADYWVHGDINDCLDIGFGYVQEWGSDQLVYDEDGLGVSVKVGLDKRMEGKTTVTTGYHGNGSVDDPDKFYIEDKKNPKNNRTNKQTFRNKRAQYYWNIKDRLEATYNAVKNGVYTDPENLISICPNLVGLDVLRSELTSVRRKKGDRTLIQIESKEDMRARGVKSPNMADSLVMSFANPAPVIKAKALVFKSEWSS